MPETYVLVIVLNYKNVCCSNQITKKNFRTIITEPKYVLENHTIIITLTDKRCCSILYFFRQNEELNKKTIKLFSRTYFTSVMIV